MTFETPSTPWGWADSYTEYLRENPAPKSFSFSEFVAWRKSLDEAAAKDRRWAAKQLVGPAPNHLLRQIAEGHVPKSFRSFSEFVAWRTDRTAYAEYCVEVAAAAAAALAAIDAIKEKRLLEPDISARGTGPLIVSPSAAGLTNG